MGSNKSKFINLENMCLHIIVYKTMFKNVFIGVSYQ